MRIDKYFVESWEIYTKHLVPFAIAIVICMVLGLFTLGVLFPALYTGIIMMFVKVRRGQDVDYNEVFAYMSRWFFLFIACLIMGLLVVLGLVLFILPGLLLATAWMYLLYFIVDKNMNFSQAASASLALVQQKDFWMHLLFILVAGFITWIGGAIPLFGFLIGMFLAFPLVHGAVACAYEEEVKELRA